MDLSTHFDSIVKEIVANVREKVSEQITATIKDEIVKQLEDYDFEKAISESVFERIDRKVATLQIDPIVVQKRLNTLAETVANNVETEARTSIDRLINTRINGVNFGNVMQTALSTMLENKIDTVKFPENSIPWSSIKTDEVVISGNAVVGGIITKFGSTGIDDQSTGCVITILDSAVVVENNLVTADLTVHGNLEIKGEVDQASPFYTQLTTSITNQVRGELDSDLFNGFSDIIFTKIKNDGLDLNKITVGNNEVISGTRLGYNITDSNLQRIGLLKELQVQGESVLADTLYVGAKRVGINTVEPSAALAVWDEDIEITASKQRDGTGRISTPRAQTLILGSNRNNNVILNTDGTTQIDSLKIGAMKFESGDKPPSFASTKGHVVFNTNPSVGGPLGWVCLGDAKWANFGIID